MPSVNSPLICQQPDRVVGRGDETVRAVLVEHDWDRVGLLGLEGIVSKRIGSRYVSGRTRAWLKTKNPDFSAQG